MATTALDLLEEIEAEARAEHRAVDALVDLVVKARAADFTWPEIAVALGVTKQSAWSRFRRYCP